MDMDNQNSTENLSLSISMIPLVLEDAVGIQSIL